ncbi:hypothetical protein [Comamonas antarctica]|uniref:Uncharacterized protein n=1 Tax=Comamonas antarctica TaxID=2743470 RepID=A0A6N1X3W2_9BURK|nr:hypothetical protein [Comamonas antarctica]QKV54031.1 hypothetical protein HUK68_14615 [Comamonas antarctica]
MPNKIQPRSLMPSSQAFLEKAQSLNAGNKAAATGARAALTHSSVRVGAGDNREKAQSAGSAIKGMLASLSNGFMGLLHGAKRLAKSISSYVFGPSNPQSGLQPRKAMDKVARGVDGGAASVQQFLNSNAATKGVFRDLRDSVSPPSSSLHALDRAAGDAITDLKSEGKALFKDVKDFFKDR